jgi:hypothetical protein
MPAAGRGHLRASHADREQVIETLKAAFVQRRLDRAECGLRAGQALVARTYAELAALTADLPAGPTKTQPPAPAQLRAERRVARPGPVIAAATAAYAGLWVSVVFLSNHTGQAPWAAPLIFGGFGVYVFILVISVAHMVALRREPRSGGRSPRRPVTGAGSQASQRLSSADPGGQLPPGDRRHRHTAEAAPTVRPRLLPS